MAEENSKYDTREKRIVAYLIDSLITTVPLLVISRNMLSDVTTTTDFTSESFISKVTWLSSIALILHILIVLYPVFAIYLYGQTIGKKVMGVKVLDLSETKNITFLQAFLRNIVPIVFAFFTLAGQLLDFFELAHLKNNPIVTSLLSLESSFIGLWLFAQLIVMWVVKKHRAVHDFIANTVVVVQEEETLALKASKPFN